MSFLDSIGKIPGISQMLDSVGASAGSALSQALFGRTDRMSNRDFQHYQNLMDSGNPREIARQGDFLTELAPYQVNAHNTFQNGTYLQDIGRQMQGNEQLMPQKARLDKDYMDTVYAGTSAWERLGSNASPSLQAPASPDSPQAKAPMGGDFLAGIAPLAQTKMQNETAKQVANIQSRTQKEIAKIGQQTEIYKSDQSTDHGALPRSQTAESAARTLLSGAQRGLTQAQTSKTGAEEHAIQNKQTLDNMAALLASLSTETIDLGLFTATQKAGYREVLKLFGPQIRDMNGQAQFAELLGNLPPDQFGKVKTDLLQIAGGLIKGSNTLGNVLGKGGKYLSKMGKPHGAKKQVWVY